MALVYLVNKPQVLRRIARWLLLFLEYDFIVVYKPGIIHVVANALSRLPDSIEPMGVFNQTTYASFFYIGLKLLNDVIFKKKQDSLKACYWCSKSKDWSREQSLLH
jgi:hypothetical protein